MDSKFRELPFSTPAAFLRNQEVGGDLVMKVNDLSGRTVKSTGTGMPVIIIIIIC